MEIRLITAVRTHPLRGEVLRAGQPPSACVFAGDDAPGSFHAGAFVDEQLVAVATVTPEAPPSAIAPGHQTSRAFRLRGMATHADHRGRGYATALLRECIERLQDAGADVLWCNARTSAAGFYAQNGFRTSGETFDIPGIGPHVVMWTTLRGVPG